MRTLRFQPLGPIGSDCKGSGNPLPLLPLEPGYYRASKYDVDIRRCPDHNADVGSACVGGSGEVCYEEWPLVTLHACITRRCHPAATLRIQVCEDWTAGPYCSLCNVTDGSRFYRESRCLACEESLLADMLWKTILVVVCAAALLVFLTHCTLHKQIKCLQRWFFKGVVMYRRLDLRAKFKT